MIPWFFILMASARLLVIIWCYLLDLIKEHPFVQDVLFVDSGDPWNPKPTTVNNVMKMLECMHRVLKPEGIFVSITFGQVRRFSLSKLPPINFIYNNHLCRIYLVPFTTIIHVLFLMSSESVSFLCLKV